MKTRLDLFDPRLGLIRGRSKPIEFLWYLSKCLIFLTPLPWPTFLKVFILRLFGAKIGRGLIIKPRVNIHFPWKLVVGDNVWIGEEVFILNFEQVSILSNACISQRAFLCAGSHDFRDVTFRYRNSPVTIGSGAWIGACVFVCPGVNVGSESVATVGSVVTRSVPSNAIVSGNPATVRSLRWPVF